MKRDIAIVGGTGAEGRGLALRLARAGESVIIGSRDPAKAQETAASMAKKLKLASELRPEVRGMDNISAVAAADVVILTVPFPAQAGTLKQLKTAFRSGAVLIDATVPLASSIGGRAHRTIGVWQGSAAEQAAEILFPAVAVAAAFQNISSELLESDSPVDCDVIVCSDHDRARQIASELAEKIPGVRAVDGGALENARIVEQLTALLIALNLRNHARGAGLRITGLPAKKTAQEGTP
jgi:8-hydroxy-5-deazaflavin:NADPH oxidoreductase